MSTFVLVHGAFHGGWCWDKVVPLLEAKGHKVVAPDLPGHGDDKTPLAEVSMRTYSDKVCNVVNDQGEPVILVGHSMGGKVISQAAEHCADNIQALVYLAALLLGNGEEPPEGLGDLVANNMNMADDFASATIRDEVIKQAFFDDCSDEDIAWAKTKLCPQSMLPMAEPLILSDENYGRLPRVYIECLQDEAVEPALQKLMYTKLPCQQVISMSTSHSPFISAPQELADHLAALT